MPPGSTGEPRRACRRSALGKQFLTSDPETIMRSILLWLVGVPIPVIIVLKLLGVF